MRLQTFLAHAGVASRRSSEDIIGSGKVSVNGHIVRERSFPVTEGKDKVALDGKAVSLIPKAYYILNKPKGVTSTVKDAHAARTVMEFLPKGSGRLYPVGRLDRDTTGLILLTNDGDLAYRLTHPRFEVKKAYRATVKGILREEETRRLEKGVELEDGISAPAKVRVVSRTKDETVCDIEIHEGKKRQVRRMFDSVGHRVIELERASFAGIKLGSLKKGELRRLTDEELKLLRKR